MSNTFQAAWQSLFGRSEPPKPVESKPKVEYFKPTFEKPVGYGPFGYTNPYMNPDFFATEETAEWVMNRFGAKEVYERAAPGNEGPFFTCSKLQRWIRFEDGTEVNAGFLAAFFVRNPEEKYPGLAEGMVNQYIDTLRKANQLAGGSILA